MERAEDRWNDLLIRHGLLNPSPTARYFDGAGNELDRQTYYEQMVNIAQERQRHFPWWSSARRRWKRAEREYRERSLPAALSAVDNGER